jgi:hypothetical protein
VGNVSDLSSLLSFARIVFARSMTLSGKPARRATWDIRRFACADLERRVPANLSNLRETPVFCHSR